MKFSKWDYKDILTFLDFIILYILKKTVFVIEDEQHTQRSGTKQNE
jgi:hypothetical protein